MTNDPTRSRDPWPRGTSPKVSIIVTGWRSAPSMDECLRSIVTSRPGPPFEIIVTLSAPTDAVSRRIERTLSEVRILTSPVNVGFSGACNRAAAVARGDYLVFLNDDAVVEPGWLDALVETADAHPDAGVVGSRALHPDGRIQERGAVLWSDASVTLLDDGRWPDPIEPGRVFPVDFCSGVSLLVRRDSWRAVQGFDEAYFPAYYEDVDLCLKVQALGQAVLLQPRATVRHRQGASAPLRYREFLRERNRRRLIERWPHVLASCESPAPLDPNAIARSLARTRARPLRPSAGPRVPDLSTSDDSETRFLERELEILTEYVGFLESTLDARERSLATLQNRPWRLFVAAAKAIARRVPGVSRLYHRARVLIRSSGAAYTRDELRPSPNDTAPISLEEASPASVKAIPYGQQGIQDTGPASTGERHSRRVERASWRLPREMGKP